MTNRQDHGWVACPRVLQELARFECELALVADSGEPSLFQVHQDGVLQQGKRIRPLFVVIAAAFGARAESETVLDAALAVELAHAGTLYHDDIVDGAMRRRGLPAIHARYGCRTAALAGAHLLYLANRHVARCGQGGANGDHQRGSQRAHSGQAQRAHSARHWWARAAEQVCDGQLREIEVIGNVEITAKQYLRQAHLKTAALLELAAQLGAALGGARAEHTRRLVEFAGAYGSLFQIVDDITDLFAAPGVTGRETDLRLGIYNLPVVLALEKEDDGRLCELLRNATLPYSSATLDQARALVDRVETGHAALAIARTFAERALAACRELPAGGPRTSLVQLTEITLGRGRAVLDGRPRPARLTPTRRASTPRERGDRRLMVTPALLLSKLPSRLDSERRSPNGERPWLSTLLPRATGDALANGTHAAETAQRLLTTLETGPSPAGSPSEDAVMRWSLATTKLAMADAVIAASFRPLASLSPDQHAAFDARVIGALASAVAAGASDAAGLSP